MAATSSDAHFCLSTLRESLIEHLFVGELLRQLWRTGPVVAEVLKPQVDATGYDVVLACDGVLRHVQLKSSSRTARTANQKVHVELAAKPSGCVVWVQFDEATMELGPYLYFGGAPGEPLPNLGGFRTARHTKADASGYKAERPNHRVVPKGRFTEIESIDGVIEALFGEVRA